LRRSTNEETLWKYCHRCICYADEQICNPCGDRWENVRHIITLRCIQKNNFSITFHADNTICRAIQGIPAFYKIHSRGKKHVDHLGQIGQIGRAGILILVQWNRAEWFLPFSPKRVHDFTSTGNTSPVASFPSSKSNRLLPIVTSRCTTEC